MTANLFNRTWSVADVDRVTELGFNHYSISDIAMLVGRSVEDVRKLVVENGIFVRADDKAGSR